MFKKIIIILFLAIIDFINIILGQGTLSQIRDKSSPVKIRDPFSLPSIIHQPSKESPHLDIKRKESLSERKSQEINPSEMKFKLKAIFIGENIRLAFINQRILTIGDQLNEEKVIEIHSDRVILEKGGNRRTIFLDEKLLKINVEEEKNNKL